MFSTRIDLVGRKFGELTVLKYEFTSNKCCYWRCRCSCGKEKIFNGKMLKRGRRTSCGDFIHHIKPMEGKRFGKLVVDKLSHVDRIRGAYWLCKCDCGKTNVVSTHNLNQGHTNSCGCGANPIKDLTGQRFGRLVVIEQAPARHPGRAFWHCNCDCGGTTIVAGNNLTSKTGIRSCGCLLKEHPGMESREITWTEDMLTGCWECSSHCCQDNIYPSIRIKGRVQLISRLMFKKHYPEQLTNGEIPKGIFVCHHCDNPKCINPKHLFLGTPLDNVRDMIAKGRGNKVKGAQIGTSKLTNKQVIEIRKRELPRQQLAEKYNVSVGSIDLILAGKTWKHLL